MAVTDRISGLNIGVAFKPACVVCATTAITLSGLQTIDGVAVGSQAERVLVPFQTDAVDRGIYVSDSGAWVRASDCDGSRDVVPGSLVYVDRGSAYARTIWVFNSSSTDTTISIDTDEVTLSQATLSFSGASAWVEANLFPVTSDSSARSVINSPSCTDVVKLAVSNTFLATNTFSTDVSFASSTIVYSAHGGSTFGPIFVIDRQSTSAAAGDALGCQTFRGRDGANGIFDYAHVGAEIVDHTTGTQDGRLTFKTASSGSTCADRFYVGLGLYDTASTDPGTNSINVSGEIKVDGVNVESGWTYSTGISTSSTTSFRIALLTDIPSTCRDVELMFYGVKTNTAASTPLICLGSATALAIASTLYRASAGYSVSGGAQAYVTYHGFALIGYGAGAGNDGAYGKMNITRYGGSTEAVWSCMSIVNTSGRVHYASGMVDLNIAYTPVVTIHCSATTIFFTGGEVKIRYR